MADAVGFGSSNMIMDLGQKFKDKGYDATKLTLEQAQEVAKEHAGSEAIIENNDGTFSLYSMANTNEVTLKQVADMDANTLSFPGKRVVSVMQENTVFGFIKTGDTEKLLDGYRTPKDTAVVNTATEGSVTDQVEQKATGTDPAVLIPPVVEGPKTPDVEEPKPPVVEEPKKPVVEGPKLPGTTSQKTDYALTLGVTSLFMNPYFDPYSLGANTSSIGVANKQSYFGLNGPVFTPMLLSPLIPVFPLLITETMTKNDDVNELLKAENPDALKKLIDAKTPEEKKELLIDINREIAFADPPLSEEVKNNLKSFDATISQSLSPTPGTPTPKELLEGDLTSLLRTVSEFSPELKSKIPADSLLMDLLKNEDVNALEYYSSDDMSKISSQINKLLESPDLTYADKNALAEFGQNLSKTLNHFMLSDLNQASLWIESSPLLKTEGLLPELAGSLGKNGQIPPQKIDKLLGEINKLADLNGLGKGPFDDAKLDALNELKYQDKDGNTQTLKLTPELKNDLRNYSLWLSYANSYDDQSSTILHTSNYAAITNKIDNPQDITFDELVFEASKSMFNSNLNATQKEEVYTKIIDLLPENDPKRTVLTGLLDTMAEKHWDVKNHPELEAVAAKLNETLSPQYGVMTAINNAQDILNFMKKEGRNVDEEMALLTEIKAGNFTQLPELQTKLDTLTATIKDEKSAISKEITSINKEITIAARNNDIELVEELSGKLAELRNQLPLLDNQSAQISDIKTHLSVAKNDNDRIKTETALLTGNSAIDFMKDFQPNQKLAAANYLLDPSEANKKALEKAGFTPKMIETLTSTASTLKPDAKALLTEYKTNLQEGQIIKDGIDQHNQTIKEKKEEAVQNNLKLLDGMMASFRTSDGAIIPGKEQAYKYLENMKTLLTSTSERDRLAGMFGMEGFLKCGELAGKWEGSVADKAKFQDAMLLFFINNGREPSSSDLLSLVPSDQLSDFTEALDRELVGIRGRISDFKRDPSGEVVAPLTETEAAPKTGGGIQSDVTTRTVALDKKAPVVVDKTDADDRVITNQSSDDLISSIIGGQKEGAGAVASGIKAKDGLASSVNYSLLVHRTEGAMPGFVSSLPQLQTIIQKAKEKSEEIFTSLHIELETVSDLYTKQVANSLATSKLENKINSQDFMKTFNTSINSPTTIDMTYDGRAGSASMESLTDSLVRQADLLEATLSITPMTPDQLQAMVKLIRSMIEILVDLKNELATLEAGVQSRKDQTESIRKLHEKTQKSQAEYHEAKLDESLRKQLDSTAKKLEDMLKKMGGVQDLQGSAQIDTSGLA